MSGLKPHAVGPLATLDDCDRLWTTLTIEYIPGLRVELTPDRLKDGRPVCRLELVDYSDVHTLPDGPRSVWAVREFQNPLYLISHTQLFDLLISGFKVIDEYFRTGKDNRPRPSKG